MSDEVERERAKYEALAALVDGYRRERDEAREQLYMTKCELGRWVDRETKAARERDEAREERDDARSTIDDLNDEISRGREAIRIYRMETDAAQRERDEARASVADAYRHGAEAMREACAVALMADGLVLSRERAANVVRALPIPEEP